MTINTNVGLYDAVPVRGYRVRSCHIPREKIMRVRKLAHEGANCTQIIDKLGLTLSTSQLSKQCRTLKIRLAGGRKVHMH
jgi:hypothetical protein